MSARIWIIAVASFSVVAIGNAVHNGAAYSAQDKTESSKRGECSNATLKGTYGIQMQGTRPIPGGTGLEAVIGVVIRTYDGAGSFTQVDNIKGATSGMVPDRPGSGTYEVQSNCSGTTRFVPGPGLLIEERFVILDYGHEIRSITSSPPPAMTSTVAKRTGLH